MYKLERRGTGTSWSFVLYLPEDGPFRIQNVSGVTITPSALNGNITLTASQPIFKNSHVTGRSLWRIASTGQVVTEPISGDNVFTDPIRVTGSGDARLFSIFVEGTFVATVTLQFAFDPGGPWNDQGLDWTAPVSTSLNDQQDGQIIFYRIGIKTGDYTSGTATCTLSFTGGSIQSPRRSSMPWWSRTSVRSPPHGTGGRASGLISVASPVRSISLRLGYSGPAMTKSGAQWSMLSSPSMTISRAMAGPSRAR
jgi:hypothetical protein